jgi:hypothetical protein
MIPEPGINDMVVTSREQLAAAVSAIDESAKKTKVFWLRESGVTVYTLSFSRLNRDNAERRKRQIISNIRKLPRGVNK